MRNNIKARSFLSGLMHNAPDSRPHVKLMLDGHEDIHRVTAVDIADMMLIPDLSWCGESLPLLEVPCGD